MCFVSVLLVLLTGVFADLFSVLTNYGSELYATDPDNKGGSDNFGIGSYSVKA